jgi:uncharacterized protein (TIGR03067 family)
MRPTLLLAALLPLFLAADAPKDDPGKKDLDRMQGDWAAESYTVGGMKLPDDEAQSIFRSVKGDEYAIYHFRKQIGKGRFTLDATRKPKQIDAMPANAPKDSKPMLGIYEVDGDTLTICIAQAGKDRPTAFESKEGSDSTLIVWKREKK